MNTRFHGRRAAVAVALGLLVTACGAGGGSAEGGSGPAINIAYQPGTGYAPLIIMKQEGLLEDRLSGVTVNWRQLAGGADVRDGIAGNRLQAGAGGVPPFLIGLDTGVPWRIAGGMNDYPSALLVKDERIQSIKDIRPKDKIAVTTPGATQDLTLRKLADEQFGDPNRFADQLLALPHPDSVAALETGSVQVHGSNAPFQAQQIAEGARSIGDLYEAFGKSSLLVTYASEKFYDEQPKQYEAFRQALAEAIKILNEDPERAAKALAAENPAADEKQLLAEVTDPDMTWTETPTGIFEVAEFMVKIDLLSNPLDNWKDAVWPDVAELKGS